MEIRNNYSTPMANQSFGMAFLKPAPEDMEKFVQYVTKGKNPKFVKRGLKQLQQKHAKDVNFDFYYRADGNQIHVVPKSDKAKQMFPEKRVINEVKEESYPTRFQEACEKMDNDLLRVGSSSKLVQICVGVKSLFNIMKEGLRLRFIDKTDALPANLRLASATIRKRDAQIAKQIEKENLIDKALK